jgi:hypothetical protein
MKVREGGERGWGRQPRPRRQAQVGSANANMPAGTGQAGLRTDPRAKAARGFSPWLRSIAGGSSAQGLSK